MEEVEKILYELRQGLSQHIFYYFDQLKRHVSETDAADFILEEVEKIEGLFTKTTSSSLFSALEDLEQFYKDKNMNAVKEIDYDSIYETEDMLKAIKLVKTSLKETEHGN